MLLLLFFFFLHIPQIHSSPCLDTAILSKSMQKCLILPTQQASLAWTFHPTNSTLELLFLGTFISQDGWVGFGLNPTSPEMTGTRALIAFLDPSSGKVVLLPYILDPMVKLQNSPLHSHHLDIHLLSSSATMCGGTVQNGATMEIRMKIVLVPSRTRLHVVWNRGVYVQGYSPTMHPMTTNDLLSIATFDILSGSMINIQNQSETLKVIHGIANALSWGFLLPLGAAVARYLRPIQAIRSTWYYAHLAIQISAILIGTVGFAIGIKLAEHSASKGVYGLHGKLGIMVFCLGWLQTVALLFRPKTTNKYQKYWKSYHHFVGYACVVMGVVNVVHGFIVLGVENSYSKLSYYLCLSTLLGSCMALEVNSWVIFCRKSKEEKMKRGCGLSGGDPSVQVEC